MGAMERFTRGTAFDSSSIHYENSRLAPEDENAEMGAADHS